MAEVLCTIPELTRQRPGAIANSLSRLTEIHPYIPPKTSPGAVVLAASFGNPPDPDPRTWTFPSTADSINCHYRERWLPVDRLGERWKLQHVYLHLLRHRSPELPPEEIFAFHWHPLPPAVGHGRRPHLHLKLAPQPLPRAHIVVTLSVEPENQGTMDYLDRLLLDAIDVIETEVLNRLNAA